MKLLFLLLTLILTACASSPKLDAQKIRPWRSELESEYPDKKVVIAQYHRGPYSLYDLTARHAADFGSDTFDMVQELFSRFQFNAVVIESIPYSSGESPKWFVETAKRGRTEKSVREGESGLVAILADERHIRFFAGEPDHQDIYRALKGEGYSDLDVIAFYSVRQVPQWVRENSEIKDLLEREIPPFAKHYCHLFEIQDCPTLTDVRRWYEQKSGRPLSVNVDNEELAPIFESKNFMQRMSSDIGFVRDHFTLTVIETLLRKYKSVAVVYGASHFITLRKSFDSYFGPPEFDGAFNERN